MEDTANKLKRQLAEAETKIQQQMRDFESYKNQLHTKPEVRLQSEINLLTLEKVSSLCCCCFVFVRFRKRLMNS